jgi:type IV pilus assembly protein PilX
MNRRLHVPGRPRGFSLIVAMLMLVAIGLASAAIMRNATSADQVANNSRLQTQALQYAQVALRLCESQLALAAPSRSVTLQPAVTPPAWTVPAEWRGRGAAHRLTAAEIGSPVRPRVLPQCLMEAATLPDLYTVTARGFSADYLADPVTGITRNGSTVWLQATIHASGEGGPADVPGGALTLRQRVWQQLLTPPF